MDDDRLITSSMRMEDTDIEQSLRPMSLSEYIGPVSYTHLVRSVGLGGYLSLQQ